MAEARVRGFSIATKCASVDELIEKFRDRVDDASILVNTVEARDIGTECAFAILLADKKVALAGTCIVRDVYSDANNPFMRPGMRLEIKRLGPESQKVWAQLIAKRIAPRKMTQALPVIAVPRTATDSIPPVKPVIVMPRGARPKTEAPRNKPAADIVVPRTSTSTLGSRSGIPDSVQRRATQPMRGLRAESPALEVAGEAPRRISSVQIPPREEVTEEPLARAPRATPFELDTIATAEQKLEQQAADQVEWRPAEVAPAEAKPAEVAPAEVKPAVTTPEAVGQRTPVDEKPAAKREPRPAPRVEERVPGSPYILPANPLTNISDASLEGFVDCRLFEAKGALASPAQLAIGTRDEDEADDGEPAVIRDSLRPADFAAAAAAARAASDGIVRARLDSQRSEPLPLPPPPALGDQGIVEPARPTPPLPYAHTKLPDLNIPGANDRVRSPLVPRTVRNRLLAAVLLVPLLGAGAVVAYMSIVAAPTPTIAAVAPATLATVDPSTTLVAAVEPAPPTPVVETAPQTPQPIRAVFVQSYPIAAKVTVGKRSFGTTPTYIKIPANTAVQIRLERPGFKPVAYPYINRKPIDRVFVRLQRRGGR